VAYWQIPFTSESLNKVGKRASASNITYNRFRPRTFLTGYDIGGTINGVITYENIDWLLLGAMGSVATGAASSPFTNIYAPTVWSSTFPSFSIEVSKGDVPTGKVFQWVGAYVAGLTLNFSASGESTFSADIIAKDETSTAVTGATPEATAASVCTDIAILPNEVTTQDVGVGASAAYCIRSGQIQISTPYANDRPCLGAYAAKLPLPSGVGTVSGNFIVEFSDRLAYDAFVADTPQTTAQLSYTGPVFIATDHYVLNCFLNNIYYVKALGNIDGPGPVLAEIGFEAEGTSGSGTTSQPIAFSTINGVNGDSVL
jgi:hypothetical protein